ncbi:MAG: flavin reductase [Oscillospiraceae bacterium]|nr:flavin reductase [Oscillospiraceae bacterium]
MSSIDTSALFRIGYGLYVVTCRDGEKDNGLIVNTVCQVTSTPNRVAVTINKSNYSHDVIRTTGVLNVNCLSEDAPFSLFQRFGFQSGRDADKFLGLTPDRTQNGLAMLPQYINALLSLQVEQYIDLDTHGMFICALTEAKAVSDAQTMTYTYYQNHVKPKPAAQKKKGFVCKICGWVYEGEELPPDLVCPICKHPASDFEPLT